MLGTWLERRRLERRAWMWKERLMREGWVPWSAGMISAITPLGWASGLCAAGLGLAGRQAVEGGPGGLSGLGTV